MRRFSVTTRLLAAAAIAGMLVTGAPAVADQSACRDLEARLASVTQGGDRTKLRRYDRAIISQKQQLERTRIRQQNAGCATFLSSIKPHCGEIRSTIGKMERNLLQLQRTRNGLAGGDVSQEKARIVAALNDNGCRGATAGAGSEERPTGLFARLFGDSETPRKEPSGTVADGQRNRIIIRNRSIPPGNYRTLCVRTCDGYFFPIAYSSSPRFFDRDTKACQSMCPGTEVELYYHRAPGEETDAMVSSVSGEPYTALPSAFSYRDPGYERTKACQCNPPKAFSIIAGDLPEQTGEDNQAIEEAALSSETEARTDPAEDPETRANREGGLTTSAIAELLAPKIAAKKHQIPADTRPETNRERRVRVVGPTFLPDPEGAIDLRAPGRTELR